jgi:hypothetical protein
VPSLLPRSKKLRTALAVVGSVVLVGAIVAVMVSSADSGSDQATRGTTKSPPTNAAKKTWTKLLPGGVVVQSAGPPFVTVRPPVRRAVMGATQRYFDDAIQAPLRNGRVNVAYSKVFDPGVNGLAARRDRAALTDAATGPIKGNVRMLASRVRIDGLADPTGQLTLVATTFTLKVKAATPTGQLTIKRNTELTFSHDSGRWLVTAYRVTVRRSLGAKTTTTTAQSGPGTTS